MIRLASKTKGIILLLAMLTMFLCPAKAISPQAGEFLRQAQVQANSGNLKSARNYYKRAFAIDSQSSEILAFGNELDEMIKKLLEDLSNKAFTMMQEKNLPLAEKYYKEILIYDPEDSEALSSLNEIAEITKQIKEYNKQGLALDSSSGRSYDVSAYSALSNYQRALAFFRKGEAEKALALVNEILAKEPLHGEALKLKDELENYIELSKMIEQAESSFQKQSMKEVVQVLTELLNKAPNQNQYYLMRAKAYLRLKSFYSARLDLWSYYKFHKDKNSIFPLLADVYAEEGKHLWALGFAYDKDSKSYLKPFSWVLKNYFYAYYWGNLLLILLFCILLPIAYFVTWQMGENLFSKFTFKKLFNFLKCLFFVTIGNIDKCLKDLEEVARDLNYPWINYITAIALLDNSDFVKAQRFFKYSIIDKALKAKALYFHGITSKRLNQKAFDTDFEESVLASLENKSYKTWQPWYLKKIENHLLIRYDVPDNDSLESMAHKLLKEANQVA